MNLKRLRELGFEKVLFFLTILFLPTQLGKHFWPQFSYIYSLRIDYLSPTLYFWDLLVLGLLISWVFRKASLNKASLSVLLFYLLTQALSLVNASNVGSGLFRLEQLLIIGAFGLYVSCQRVKDISSILFWGLVFGIVFESLLSIAQYLRGSSIGFWILGERSFSLSAPTIATFNFYGQVFLRPYGTFPHPNVLAGFMIVSLPLLTIFSPKKSYSKNLAIMLGTVSTVLSFSRAAIFVLFLESFLLFKGKFKWFLILILLTLPLLFVRFESAFNFDNLSIIRREELAEIALGQFKQNPVFGVGINNFINRVSSSDLVSGPNRFLQPVHNIYLLTLAESGVLGFLGLLGLLGVSLVKAYKKSKKLFGVILAVLFLGFFDHYFLTIAQGQRLLFLIWGLAMLEWKNANHKESL